MENELFEKAPVPKAYFTLALPVVFSMVVSLVYNMVDTYFIAQTGNTNLVAGLMFHVVTRIYGGRGIFALRRRVKKSKPSPSPLCSSKSRMTASGL